MALNLGRHAEVALSHAQLQGESFGNRPVHTNDSCVDFVSIDLDAYMVYEFS